MSRYVMRANSPQEVLDDLIQWFERSAGNLYSHAGLTTGRDRKDFEAQAAYAGRCARFLKDMEIEPK